MEIRKSVPEDEAAILKIFAVAKDYMAAHGNKTQWIDGYPGTEVLLADIHNNNSYVLENHGAIVGTFSLIIGEEANYRQIENGAWNYDRTYGTIHRLASDGTVKGVAGTCFAYCLDQIDYLRIDTHRNNRIMQAAIEKFGFRKCGIIRVQDGSERIAYDYLKTD